MKKRVLTVLFSATLATACVPGTDDGENLNNGNGNGNIDPSLCGNGRIDFGEQCDDGNTDTCDGCSDTCQVETGTCCGNRVMEYGEECDDGNTTVGDGCDDLCRLEYCGNLRVDHGEECDDGNTDQGDGCNHVCLTEECGNNVIDINEECDGSDLAGETCDLLGYYGGQLTCDSTCVFSDAQCNGRCGDSVIDDPEECDDGNTDTGDGCDDLCLGEPGTCLVDTNLGSLFVGATIDATVHTHGSHALYEASCGGSSTRERVLQITATEWLDLEIDFSGQTGDHTISVFRDTGQDCDVQEVACQDTQGAASGSLDPIPIFSGTYFIIVDAAADGDEGTLYLHLAGATSTMPCTVEFGNDGTYRGCEVSTFYEDIRSNGTSVKQSATDDSEHTVSLGFTFNFYGQDYTDITIGMNGGFIFNSSGSLSTLSYCLPYSVASSPAALAWWDDLDPNQASQGLWTDTLGPPGARRFIAQWVAERFSGTSGTVDFQMVLHEGTNHLEMRYSDTTFASASYDHGINATVGIEAGASGPYVEYSCDQASLTDGLSLMFYRL